MSTFKPLAKKDDPKAFRAEVRAWLKATVPPDWGERMTGASDEEAAAFQHWWIRERHKVGLATSHWPKEWGGADLSLRCQIIVLEEIARIDGPLSDLFTISLYHLPATLFEHGTQAQRDKYLGGVLNNWDVWCQGFSEPGAGSDLASLRTRAERKGDVYVVNGQKIWSSYGRVADYCLLLARTDPSAKKHAGISYFILDMNTPGITKRPIRQINGCAEFTELFFDNVEIPVANLIGQENQGWMIAQSTLSAERGLIIFELVERMAAEFDRDLEEIRSGRDSLFEDDQFRRDFIKFYADMRATRLLVRRMLRQIEENPNMSATALPQFIKVQFAEVLHGYTEFRLRLDGLSGNRFYPNKLAAGQQTRNRMFDFLTSYSWTISGGTSEVMRNLIAERTLGLPR